MASRLPFITEDIDKGRGCTNFCRQSQQSAPNERRGERLSTSSSGGSDGSGNGGDDNAYTKLQIVLTALGLEWIVYFGPQLQQLASLPGDSWRTHLNDDDLSKTNATRTTSIDYNMLESGETSIDAWQRQQQPQQEQGNDLLLHSESGETSIDAWQRQQQPQQEQGNDLLLHSEQMHNKSM